MTTFVYPLVLCIVGIIGTYIFTKWQMKKNEIVHFYTNAYEIGKGLSDEFPDFKLHFGDDVLSGSVMVLKGGFMNTGRNDINGLKGQNDIKLILPNECKIKAFTISPSTEDLVVSAIKDNEKENILKFGISELFKTDEYFKYTVIIETSKEIESLHSELKFHHRISNTDKIKNVYNRLQSNSRNSNFGAILFITLFMIFLGISSTYRELPYKIYQKSSGKEVNMYIDLNSKIYVNEGIPIPYVSGTVISSDELEKDYKIVPITNFKWGRIMIIRAISFFLFILIISFFLYKHKLREDDDINNVLKD